jgi:TRAP-type C4-dicarboxylate transport system permease small subunit
MKKKFDLVFYFDSIGKYSSFISGISAGVLIFCTALLVIIDVIGRAVGASLLFAEEISRYLLIATVYLGLAHTQRKGRHIEINLFTRKLSHIAQEIVALVALAIAMILVSWLAWVTVEPVIENYVLQVKSIGVIHTPMWIPYLIVPIGSAMFALELLLEVIKKIYSLKNI